MLFANTGTNARHVLERDHEALTVAEQAVWLDLLDPDEGQRALAERASGLRVPARSELEEIESSSRLTAQDGVLILSTPLVTTRLGEKPVVLPLGFVLSSERLLTIRYAPFLAFDRYAEHFAHGEEGERSSVNVFLGLIETIVDRLADVLEHVDARLETISDEVFRRDQNNQKKWDAALQRDLRGVGEIGQFLGKARSSLFGISRICDYASTMMGDALDPEARARFQTLHQDLASLQDHQHQASETTQFMLDATLGFINIQQNNVMKVLTVASIVGIPPTLVAGIYGMNFKNMPELSWAWGYPYSLALIVVTALLPLAWFRKRGWI